MASVTLSPTGASGSGWSNPSRVTASDNSRASITVAGGGTSGQLSVSFPSAGLNAGDIIDGILVEVEGRASGSGISLSGGSAGVTLPQGSTKTDATGWFTGINDSIYSLGGSSDLWGGTWSASDFNSGWSLSIRVSNSSGPSRDALIDYVSVTIYYHAGAVEVNADRSLSWSVRTPATADRSLSWAVRTGVTADRNLSWSVRSAITADRALSWAVRQAITADRALAWSVRQAIATDRDLAWAVRELVDADRVLLWDVEPAVGVVVVDRGLSWDIRAIVNADRAVSWDVRTLTAADSVLLWDVRELAESDRDLAWAVREIVEADRELVWRVRTNAIIRQITVHGSARAAQVVSGAPHVLAVSGSLHVMPAVSGSLREGISATGSARQPVIVKGSPA